MIDGQNLTMTNTVFLNNKVEPRPTIGGDLYLSGYMFGEISYTSFDGLNHSPIFVGVRADLRAFDRTSVTIYNNNTLLKVFLDLKQSVDCVVGMYHSFSGT